jgi:hypothetical protein
MALQMTQEGPQEVCHVHGLEVLRLEPEVEAQVLALGRPGEGRQGGDPVMRIVVRDDQRMPLIGTYSAGLTEY